MIGFRKKGDVVTARFTTDEGGMITNLALQLIELLSERAAGDATADLLFAQLGIGGSSAAPLDPALARLLPDAYRGDEVAASDHRRLTERSLVGRKIANARTVVESLQHTPVTLDPDQVQAWLRTLTDIRLALAARLHIEQDGDEGDDPDLAWVYDWFGAVQGMLLEEIDG